MKEEITDTFLNNKPPIGERQLYKALDNLLEGFIILSSLRDESGRIKDFVYLYANPAAAADAKISTEKMIGSSLTEIFPEIKNSPVFEACCRVAEKKTPEILKSLRYQETIQDRVIKGYFDISISPCEEDSISLSWHDVTDIKRRELKLKKSGLKLRRTLNEIQESKELFRLMGETLPYGIWMCDKDGNAKYMSQSFLDLLEMTEQEAANFGWSHRLKPGTEKAMFEKWTECIKTGKDWDYEHIILGPDGKYHTVLTRGKPVRDNNGNITSWVGINLDIDDRKLMENELSQALESMNGLQEALSYQKQLLETILETLPVGVFTVGANGAVISANEEAKTIWGGVKHVKPDNYKTYKAWDYVTGEELPIEKRAAYRAAVMGESVYQMPVKIETFDEKIKVVLNSSVPIRDKEGTIQGAVIVNQDVTDLMRISEELKEREEHFHALADNISQFAWMADKEGSLFWYNKRWYDYTGTTLDEMKGWGWQKVHHPGFVDQVTEKFRNSVNAGTPWEDTFPLRGKDGNYRWFLSRALPIRDEKEEITLWFGTNTDITEQKILQEKLNRTVEKLKANQSKFLRAEEMAHIGSWVADVRKKTIECSAEYSRIMGLDSEEGTRSWLDFGSVVHPDDLQKVNETITAAIKENRGFEFEMRLKLNDGQVKHIYTCCSPGFDGKGNMAFLYGATMDITERKIQQMKLEEIMVKLARSNKELEQFAHIAAHDLKEPLRTISSFTTLLERKFSGKLDEAEQQYMSLITDGAKRMNALISDLLAFAKLGRIDKPHERIDCNLILKDVTGSLSATIEEMQAVIKAGPLPEVHGDPVQIKQLFQNLLANGLKFCSERKPEIYVSCITGKNDYIFAVKDNGIGIPGEFKERIFQLFQRLHTREEYPGTGIGLSICKKIVEAHNGRIWFESIVGEGTTFYFTLPAREPDYGEIYFLE